MCPLLRGRPVTRANGACSKCLSVTAMLMTCCILYFVGENAKEDVQGKRSLSEKVSLYRGDITLLEVDAIVNAGRWLNVVTA